MFWGTVFLSALLSWSCHLEDFNLDKLADANDIKPVAYAPAAYGTYKVGDILFTNYADDDTVKVPELDLDPIIYDKTGVTFSSPAIDSVYMVVHFTNGTPMKMQVLFKFIDLNSGTAYGKIFNSGVMQAGKMDATGKVIESVTTRVEFPMNSSDLNNFNQANGIEFEVKLFQPDSGSVVYKNLRESLFKVQISFRAPVSLWKLK